MDERAAHMSSHHPRAGEVQAERELDACTAWWVQEPGYESLATGSYREGSGSLRVSCLQMCMFGEGSSFGRVDRFYHWRVDQPFALTAILAHIRAMAGSGVSTQARLLD